MAQLLKISKKVSISIMFLIFFILFPINSSLNYGKSQDNVNSIQNGSQGKAS